MWLLLPFLPLFALEKIVYKVTELFAPVTDFIYDTEEKVLMFLLEKFI